MTKEELRRKAQELCYISIKSANFIDNQQLRQKIESLSYGLIESIYAQNVQEARKQLSSIQGIVALASNTQSINSENADFILASTQKIEDALETEVQSSEKPTVKLLDSSKYLKTNKKKNKEASNLNKAEIDINSKKAKKRQNRIVQAVEKLGRAQLKEIVEELPDISERTIRYDLRRLCLKSSLVRHGSGGPGNYYTLANSAKILESGSSNGAKDKQRSTSESPKIYSIPSKGEENDPYLSSLTDA